MIASLLFASFRSLPYTHTHVKIENIEFSVATARLLEIEDAWERPVMQRRPLLKGVPTKTNLLNAVSTILQALCFTGVTTLLSWRAPNFTSILEYLRVREELLHDHAEPR